jgi:hypothetical protein
MNRFDAAAQRFAGCLENYRTPLQLHRHPDKSWRIFIIFFAFVCTLASVVVASSKPYPKNTRIRVGDACEDFLQTS